MTTSSKIQWPKWNKNWGPNWKYGQNIGTTKFCLINKNGVSGSYMWKDVISITI